MTGARLIFTVQCIYALAWGVLLIRKWGAVCRVWIGTESGDDKPRAIIWFLAAAMEMGTLRWFIFPPDTERMSAAEIFFWVSVYALIIVSACALSWVYWERRNG